MKFAQYLQETQTPEWKKAYIDYRGLKKRITAIRKAQQGLNVHVTDSDSPDEFPAPATPRPSNADSESTHTNSIRPPRPSGDHAQSLTSTREVGRSSSAVQVNGDRVNPSIAAVERKSSFQKILPSLRNIRAKSFSSRLNGSGGNASTRRADPLASLPLHELLTQLSTYEVSFFTMLDAQLDKVESFYLAREKEMLSRGDMLKAQLHELNDHRKLFLKAYSKAPWTTGIAANILGRMMIRQPSEFDPPKHGLQDHFVVERSDAKGDNDSGLPNGRTNSGSTPSTSALEPLPGRRLPTSMSWGKRKDMEGEHSSDDSDETTGKPRPIPLSADPDSYLYAKRKLKRAVLEHYRGLEVLHNYRVLNITGFRKALKKFEKVTKIPVQKQYMTEKVEKSAFASDKAVREMMSQMEEMYAAAFSRGDKKKATRRLRAGDTTKSHHFSSFRSGMYLGIALPALADGLVKVFQQQTREAIPAWNTLLFLYGVILVPVLFSVLVGLNLLVWARSRINYVFIFELDVLTRLDYRAYFEIPCILLSALCYAFWLSFAHAGAPLISPTIWPLVYLAFAGFLVFDPVPWMYRSSRYWLLKNVGRQFMSGTRRVEFTDFWMGDQFCSLVFTLSNLYTFVCVYVDGFPANLGNCGSSSPKWPIPFALAALPLLVRLVQSIKRYADSKLVTHLINGGKYATGIVTYFFYFLWRHKGGHGSLFAIWCLCNACYSVYACSWDLLMDWSLLKVHNAKYRFLRPDLVYTSHVYMYYVAIVTNILIRFIWVIYIPVSGPNFMVRTFITGLLEMLRRWQWNFYRLENEHLGNMDQYRVTREVPLPYAFEDANRDDDRDDDDHRLKTKKR